MESGEVDNLYRSVADGHQDGFHRRLRRDRPCLSPELHGSCAKGIDPLVDLAIVESLRRMMHPYSCAVTLPSFEDDELFVESKPRRPDHQVV